MYARIFKWFAEKYIDPYISLPLKSETFMSRNQIMHDSVEYLENILSQETDILQEYFVPHTRFIEFIDGMKQVLKKRKVLVLNVSIRIVPQSFILLNYAPQDMFAIVLYLNQRVSVPALENMKVVTQELINLALKLGGTFFLPYQLYFTKEQLRAGYPTIDQFFTLKRRYDPSLLFTNYFYWKYRGHKAKQITLLSLKQLILLFKSCYSKKNENPNLKFEFSKIGEIDDYTSCYDC